jgi:hypothetical protein
MNTTVIVQRFCEYTLEFPKYERLDKGGRRPPTRAEGPRQGPKAPDKSLLYHRGRPRIMLLVQMVVIVFKHSLNILLVFLNMRGWTKGAEGPRQGPKAPDKPLLYPPEQTTNNFVGTIGCHRVQICCKGSWFS